MKDKVTEIELKEDEMISKYLRGQMTDEEERSFIKELSEKPELKSKAVTMARLAKGMYQVGTNRDNEVKAALADTDAETVAAIASDASRTKTTKTITLRDVGRWSSAVAAAVMLFIAGYQTAEYASPETEVPQVLQYNRSGSYYGFAEYEISVLAEMVNVYGKGDENLDAAIEHLECLWNISLREGNYYTEHRVEIGMALAEGYGKKGDNEARLNVLKKLMDIIDSDDLKTDIKSKIDSLE